MYWSKMRDVSTRGHKPLASGQAGEGEEQEKHGEEAKGSHVVFEIDI
jgi:hypothetical protein